MALKSGNHAEAEHLDGGNGEWRCKACGSESADYALFEELGDIERCIERYRPEEVARMPEETLVREARSQIEAAKNLGDMNDAAQKAGEHLREFKDALVKAGESATVEKKVEFILMREWIDAARRTGG